MPRAVWQITAFPIPRWLPGVVSAAVIFAVIYLLSEPRGSAAEFTAASFGGGASARPVVGALAPDFLAVDLNGAPVRLSDYRGRPVWINFWATWCPPCRAELPEINAVYQELRGRGLVLLAISVGEDRDTVRNYLNRAGFAIPAVLDEGNVVAAQYALAGFPTHVFIDQEGIVRDIRVGGLSQRAMQERLATVISRNGE